MGVQVGHAPPSQPFDLPQRPSGGAADTSSSGDRREEASGSPECDAAAGTQLVGTPAGFSLVPRVAAMLYSYQVAGVHWHVQEGVQALRARLPHSP